MTKYVKEFNNLNCNPEILDVVLPVQRQRKEITESMAMIKILRKIVLKRKDFQYQIFDFCAGNALTSVIASFLFKNVSCFAIDIRPREREWSKVKNFEYLNSDIRKEDWGLLIKTFKKIHPHIKTIIMSVHPCIDLAETILSIHRTSKSNYLILMPCCQGKTAGYSLPEVIVKKIGKYLRWCLYLQNKIEGNSKLYIDNFCLSPKNAIITAGL
jgi:hypothetical protein